MPKLPKLPAPPLPPPLREPPPRPGEDNGKGGPIEDAKALFDAIGATDKTMKVFTLEEGGSEHCQGDNVTLGITYIADWFSDKLDARRRA